MIGQTISHYKITAKLGEGGMGVVYRAEDTKLDRTVALKFIAANLIKDGEARKRFEREAKAAAGVSHANVCHVYEIADADGQTFLAMEFVDGEGLDRRIEHGPAALKDALDFVRQTAEGLAAAHEHRVVHRDIKPGNLLITPKGQVKILDFGLALLTEGSKLTQLDTKVGTVAYMSPEQAQGMAVDHRTDIWALGCVLYEMVSGRRPFLGHYDQALVYSIVNEPPEPLTALRTGVPMELEFIAGKCLEKDPGSRYQHASDIAVDLRNLQDKLKSGRSTILRAKDATNALPPTMAAGRTGRQVPLPSSDAVVVRRSSQSALQASAGLTAAALLIVGFLHFTEAAPKTPENLVERFSFTPELPPGQVEISPDGRRIAYVSGEETPRIWIRELAREEPRPVAGTEGTTELFWSPDSRDLGFFVGGSVKRVPVEGGPPVILCQTGPQLVIGGSWSPDGEKILFSSVELQAGPGSYVVSSRGGVPERLDIAARVESGAGPFGDLFQPQFLPDPATAEALLGFTNAAIVYLYKLETRETIRLAEGGAPTYSPTGHILYRQFGLNTRLWALPFSLEKLEATGNPFLIAEGVRSASVAANGTLVTVDDVGRRNVSHQLVWRDRAGARLSEVGQQQSFIRTLVLSPDEKWVAVAAQDAVSDNFDIWLHEIDRPIKRRLTFDGADEDMPAWTADGREIVYRIEGKGNGDLWSRRSDGAGEPRALINSELREGEHDWSRDGRFMIYQIRRPDRAFDLRYLARNDSGDGFEDKPFLEMAFNETHARLSPDGRYVVYGSNESGRHEIYVRRFPEGDGLVQVSVQGGLQPSWSADGREIYWVAGETLMAAQVLTGEAFTAGEARPLFNLPTLRSNYCCRYAVAADGRILTVDEIETNDEHVEKRKPAIHITRNWFEEFRRREKN